MSLKAFHIFFVLTAILLSFGFAYWCFAGRAADGGTTLIMGVLACAAGTGLIIYAGWMIRKLKSIE